MTPPPVPGLPDVPAAAPDGDRRAIVSWALYDLANTIYSAIVVTLFLPSYLEGRYGDAAPLGRATAITLLLSGLVSPWLGAVVDRTGRARPGLDVSTWVCVLASAALCFLGPLGLWPALLCYAVSLFGYQAALTFYNALLPAVAPPHRRGWVSGLGTGLGYLGIPVAVLIALRVKDTSLGIPGTFLVSAVLMTLGTIPLWLFVKDAPREPHDATPSGKGGARGGKPSGTVLLDTLRDLRGRPLLGLFLLANFVCVDVTNTLIQYAAYYYEKGEGLTKDQTGVVVIALSVTALVGGLVLGRLADRRSPTRLYLVTGLGLVAALLGVAFFPGRWVPRIGLVIGGGVATAAIWSIGRQLLLRLAPPERQGAYFGLYGVTVKVSILGTWLFAEISDRWSFRPAILVEAGMLVLGLTLFWRLDRRLAAERRA